MAEEDPSVDPVPSERRFFSKNKWRGKLFHSEDKPGKIPERPERPANDVNEFLQGSNRNRSNSGQSTGSTSRTGSSPDSKLASVSTTERPSARDAGYQRRKPLRRKGLRVTFSDTPPDVIGEGGDEAELPSIDIAKSRTKAKSRRQSEDSTLRLKARRSSPPPQLELPIGEEPRRVSEDNDNVRPAPLQRRSTGSHDGQHADHADEASSAHQASTTASVRTQQFVSSPSSDGDSEVFASIYSEYTQAPPLSPRVVLDQPSTQPGSERLTHKKDVGDLRNYASLKASSPEFDPSFGNSITPIPSPQPPSNLDRRPSGYDFPISASTKRSDLPPGGTDQLHERNYTSERPVLNSLTLDPSTTSPPLISPSFISPPLKSPQKSLRIVAKNLGGDAFSEFVSRVQRFYGIFRLGASANKPLEDVSFEDWVRAGTWWFLKGRSELENAVRSRPGSHDPSPDYDDRGVSAGLKQAYLNLAKASWITTEVTINHSELRKYGTGSMTSMLAIVRSFGDSRLAEVLEMHVAVTNSLRALTMSMKRNDKMPSPDFEAQGLNSRVWVDTPRFASNVTSLLRGASSRGLLENESAGPGTFFPYPLGDTIRHFNYGSMFVDVMLKFSNDPHERVHMSCLVTLLRPRSDRDLEMVVASQDGVVNLTVQSNKKAGPTWRDVHWRTESHCMILKLSDTLGLDIKFQESGFRTLWGMYDYTRNVRKNMEPRDGEEAVFKTTVKFVHHVDTPDAKVFPAEPVQGCDVRLFEKSFTPAERSGRRKLHSGHRLVVVTPASSKTLSTVSQHLGKQIPMLFSYVRGHDEGPAILLKNDAAGSTLVLTFHDTAEREQFHSLLNGTLMKDEESCSDIIPLQSMRIREHVSSQVSVGEENFMSTWRWDQLRVFNKRPEYSENGAVKTVLSENLRVWVQCEAGALIDRINLGPGELQLSLSTDQPAQLTILRPLQQDMTVTFANNKVSASKAKALSDAVKSMSVHSTLRTYVFKRLQDLHLFQRLITGFSVLYDGFATNFAISRRRMVVPIYKKWEASVARLQIVQLDKVIQLIVCLKDFPYGTCMNFVLKSTDNFESFTRSEQYYLRVVDAKFALPKKLTEVDHDYMCLDLPEYASEHDDITIGFETEAERDRFGSVLPAPVSKFSRLGSLRK